MANSGFQRARHILGERGRAFQKSRPVRACHITACTGICGRKKEGVSVTTPHRDGGRRGGCFSKYAIHGRENGGTFNKHALYRWGKRESLRNNVLYGEKRERECVSETTLCMGGRGRAFHKPRPHMRRQGRLSVWTPYRISLKGERDSQLAM